MDVFTVFDTGEAFDSATPNRINTVSFVIAEREDEFVLFIANDGEVLHQWDEIYTIGPDSELLDQLTQNYDIQNTSWSDEDAHLTLSQVPHLIELLENASEVHWENGITVTFSPEFHTLLLQTEEEEDIYSSELVLQNSSTQQSLKDDKWKWIADGYVTNGTEVLKHAKVGTHYTHLSLLTQPVALKQFPRFLAIVHSYFRNIQLEVSGYTIAKGDPIHSAATLSIDEVDEDQSLLLSVTESLPNEEDVLLLKKYNLHHWASVNQLEKKIYISPIERKNTHDLFKSLLRQIRAVCRSYKETIIQDIEPTLILNQEAAQIFVTQLLPTLFENYRLIGSERLTSFRVKQISPRLRLSIGSGIQYFDSEASLEIEGESYSLYELLKTSSNKPYIELKDGTKGLINQRYLQQLQRILGKIDKDDNCKISFFDLPLIEEFIDEECRLEKWEKHQTFYKEYNSHHNIKVPKKINKATLRDYQVSGIQWLNYLKTHKLGACLADDMGLGKTLQAIGLLAKEYKEKKKVKSTLVVMPKSLLFNWEQELEKFAPQLSHYTLHGNNRDIKEALKQNVVLTTYGFLRSQIEDLKEETFHYVILDESQNIKNTQSQTSKASLLLKANHRLALSGTPMENNLGELYSLFRFLNPAMFGSFKDLQSNYMIPIQQGSNEEVIEELRTKISPFILRRLKKDVLKDLPPKVEQHLFVEMDEKHKKIYLERQNYYQKLIQGSIKTEGLANTQFMLFQALSELRQLASIPEAKVALPHASSKREMLMEQIHDATANNHKVLIFVNFISAMEFIHKDLENQGISCLQMSGQTNDRQAIVEKFQRGNDYQVLLMTLKTGGVGLNLTAADMVYIYDPWWNAAAENQAIDRTHRMGQDKTVFCYRMITKNTIEDKILQLQEKKQQLFDQLLSGDQSSLKTLSEEDINFILSTNES